MKTFKEFTLNEASAQSLGGVYKKIYFELTDKFSVDQLRGVTKMLIDMNKGMDEKEAWNKHQKNFKTIDAEVVKVLRKHNVGV